MSTVPTQLLPEIAGKPWTVVVPIQPIGLGLAGKLLRTLPLALGFRTWEPGTRGGVNGGKEKGDRRATGLIVFLPYAVTPQTNRP